MTAPQLPDRHHGHRHPHPGRAHAHDHHREGDHDHHHHGGLRGFLTSLFAPHSHDPADAVDSALESSGEGIRAVKISLAVLLVTALAQAVVVWWTGSVALLADTVHNLADALTAVPLWIAFVLGRRPATRRYTYGFGRAEDLAGLFVVAMIALSAVVAGAESVRRLLDPQLVAAPWAVLVAGVLGFLGNEWVAVHRIRVGRRIGSAALVADGLHARTDGFTSLAVALGAGGVLLGFPLADPIVGLLITVAILAALRGALLEVFRRLMDGVDPALVDAASTTVTLAPGVRAVRHVRLRWDGHQLTAAVEIVVDRDLSLVAARALAQEVEHDLVAAVSRISRARVHAVPAMAPPTSGADRVASTRPGRRRELPQ